MKMEVHNVIQGKDRELYTYGINQGFIILLNLVTSMVIGFVMGMFLETVLFLTIYIPLRKYAGGYHAETAFSCYLLSNLMIATNLILIKVLWTYAIGVFVVSIASILILFLAPIQAKNKPLDAVEKRVYRFRTRIILLCIICILGMFIHLKLYLFATVVYVAVATQSIMLLLGLKIALKSDGRKLL
jgi:accessory gene regulator B